MIKKQQLAYYILCTLGTFFFFSCNSNKQHHDLQYNARIDSTVATPQGYHLWFHPAANTSYYYTINNETITAVEVNGTKLESNNTSEIGLIYRIQKDSIGNLVVTITYDKLHVITKSKDKETEIDGTNAANSIDPAEKLIGKIIGASLTVVMNTKGNILSVNGYKEIKDKIMEGINKNDKYTSKQVQEQLSKLIGESFVKSNMEQFTSFFPNKMVNVDDSWSSTSSQATDMQLPMTTTYTLKDITDTIATISATSKMDAGNSTTTNLMGVTATSNLKGKQDGKLLVDITTGMLLNNTSKTTLEGTVQVMGRDVPITIQINKTITGKKI